MGIYRRELKGMDKVVKRSEIDWGAPDGRLITTAQLHRIRTEAMEAGARQAVAKERARIRAAVEGLFEKHRGKFAADVALNDVLRILDPKEAE